jgi:hypothetical protein
MAADRGELVVREPSGLGEDLVGDAQLAHVVEQTAERKLAQPRLGETELLTDRDRERGHPPGVALRRRILLGEALQQRADASPQEGLLVLDEGGRVQIPGQRARGNGMAKVERHRDRDHADAAELEQMGHPEAGVRHPEVEQSVLGADQPHHADGDGEVGLAAGEQESVDRAPRQQHQRRRGRGEDQLGDE